MTNPVQVNTGTATATSASAVLTNPVTSGNAVIVAVIYSGASAEVLTSVSDDKSNVYVISEDVYDSSSNIHTALASSYNLTNAPKTFTATKPSSGHIDVVAYEINGFSATDVATTGNKTFSSAAVVMSFTTAQANEFAVAAAAASSAVTFTQNNGWTQNLASSLTFAFVFSNTVGAAGVNSCTATPVVGTTTRWVTLAALPGAAPPAGGGVSGATVSRDSNPYPGTVAYRVGGAGVTQHSGLSRPNAIN